MKVLLTGAAGQVGSELALTLVHHDLVALDRQQLDITDRSEVIDTTRTVRPDVIINSAAWTSTDQCEDNPDQAELINGRAVGHLVEAAGEVGARVVQISTDYVFDGTLDRPYVETDEPRPRSAYGRSKLLGERSTRPEDTIIRTSWVVGRFGSNMAKTILRLVSERPVLRFVTDQVGHPTLAHDLATMITRLVDEERNGLFHVTNQGAVSWFTFAREVLAAAGLDPERIEPVLAADLDPPQTAPRPANSVLENAALADAGIPLLPDHREPLARLVTELLELPG